MEHCFFLVALHGWKLGGHWTKQGRLHDGRMDGLMLFNEIPIITACWQIVIWLSGSERRKDGREKILDRNQKRGMICSKTSTDHALFQDFMYIAKTYDVPASSRNRQWIFHSLHHLPYLPGTQAQKNPKEPFFNLTAQTSSPPRHTSANPSRKHDTPPRPSNPAARKSPSTAPATADIPRAQPSRRTTTTSPARSSRSPRFPRR